MDTREAFTAKLKAQVDEWNADIQKLEAKVCQMQADKQMDYNQQLDTLRQHRDQAQQHLTQVQQAAENTWESVKQEMESTWTRISNAFTNSRARWDQSKAA